MKLLPNCDAQLSWLLKSKLRIDTCMSCYLILLGHASAEMFVYFCRDRNNCEPGSPHKLAQLQ